LDSALEDVCSASATKVNFEAGRCSDLKDFLDSLRELIRKAVGCEGVAIFLVSDSGDRLELKASTGTTWMVPQGERYYRKGEGLTGSVWQSGDTFLTVAAYREARSKHKSCEGAESRERDDCLLVPLGKPTGEVIGVVRCRRKDIPQTSSGRQGILVFSDDDASVVESIAQAAAPHLEVLLAQERRARALGRLTHELKVPLVAIRGATEFMMETPGVHTFFDYDYPGDISSWAELMSRLIDNADILRYSRSAMTVRDEPTALGPNIIVPAIKQVRLLLEGRGFLAPSIRYNEDSLRHLPMLWLDRNQFQQVLFNLLSNAIKYAEDNPNDFRIEIDSDKCADGFLLRFRDWGPGIEAGMEELIFEEGVRGRQAIQRDVAGQGLGLWVARQIVNGHGGRITATNHRKPTEFTIFLPKALALRAPRQGD
jgi:signal transduction histidine kinase